MRYQNKRTLPKGRISLLMVTNSEILLKFSFFDGFTECLVYPFMNVSFLYDCYYIPIYVV